MLLFEDFRQGVTSFSRKKKDVKQYSYCLYARDADQILFVDRSEFNKLQRTYAPTEAYLLPGTKLRKNPADGSSGNNSHKKTHLAIIELTPPGLASVVALHLDINCQSKSIIPLLNAIALAYWSIKEPTDSRSWRAESLASTFFGLIRSLQQNHHDWERKEDTKKKRCLCPEI